MNCSICGKRDCSCSTDKGGPTRQKFGIGFGNDGPWDRTPPKTTTSAPRLGVEPFNNSPRQPDPGKKLGS